MLGSELIFVHY